jgi:DNA-binding PucR family transcriptional regulator
VAWAARLPGAIGANLDPVGVALVPVPERPVPGRTAWQERVTIAVRDQPAVLGPVVELARASRSVARAQAAWPLHVAGLLGTDQAGLIRADEHLLALLLAAEPELAAELCEHALAPLHALQAGAGARGEQTLRAWLDAHGDVSVAAATLHVHPQTVRYRLAALREVFGDALDDPGARLEVAIALRMTHPAPPDATDPPS